MSILEVRAPYDQRLIAELNYLNASQVETIVNRAKDLFNDRKQQLPIPKRIEILERAYQLLKERREIFAKRAAEEGGKPLTDSLVEADRAAQGIKIALEHIGQMKGTEIPMGLTEAGAHRMAYTFREPVGVVLAVSAFNHPINLIVHQVIPAIAVGCPVIVKPASSTPLSCKALIELLYEAGLPEAWAQMILCENSITEKLVADSRIAFLSFIGSAEMGWHLRSLLAPGSGCTLEHGGAAPVILAEDADLDAAIPLLTKGGFYHAGQVCISVQRIFVQESIAEKFAQRLKEQVKRLIVGDPLDVKTEVGPLIKPEEVKRVGLWVDEALAGEGELLCGGRALSETCYAPTILYHPSLKAKVCQKEIFGPVVCINPYKDLDQAIRDANALPFSFQSAVFTQNINLALDCVKRLEAKTVLVNDHTAFRVDWMPFSGRKQSGFGSGGIPYSMQDMSYEKMMIIRSSVL